ncbi:hypothetical protein, partial [Paenibacillus cisolokensis]|uniref:hypothetical protein n=1 Tax=Paenibacillus cisolokensis TaxID=1658519 RepID=UPI001BD044A2
KREVSARSLPMRERGLKPISGKFISAIVMVATHAGAWIETATPRQRGRQKTSSLPMRERGLKPTILAG